MESNTIIIIIYVVNGLLKVENIIYINTEDQTCYRTQFIK